MEHLRDDVRATATHDPANISSTYDSKVTPEPNTKRASQCHAASYSLRDNLADE
jgi:hypothetical protein